MARKMVIHCVLAKVFYIVLEVSVLSIVKKWGLLLSIFLYIVEIGWCVEGSLSISAMADDRGNVYE